MRQRLDQELVKRGLVTTRSQAESYIKLGYVSVDGNVATKPAMQIADHTKIILTAKDQYVSRAALKMASVSEVLGLDFNDKVVLDVGSSTGGFTDFALRHGAKKVIAVEVGKDQLHPSLHGNPKIELHEQTDIRNFAQNYHKTGDRRGNDNFDVVVADVSFVSMREILPAIGQLSGIQTQIVVMVKPQFEALNSNLKHKGVIKNDRMRREILKDFEAWAQKMFVVIHKADSQVAGAKGNLERFYLLGKVS